MIDTKTAKKRILSLAFRGMLVDYSQKEKKNDSLDTLHKAQKNFLAVSEVECLTDIPSYWNWSRLGYVTNNHGQIVPDKDFCYIDVGTLDNVHQRLAATENLVAAKEAPSRARKVVHVGDVLYSTVRPYLHNICIVDREFSRTPIASTAFCVMHANDSVLLNKFLFYWLLTREFDEYSNGDSSKGTLYPAIGEKDLLNGVIPIPPLEEQLLIVEKIEAAFLALDTIDALQVQYADNLNVLKSKLIDAAIQGKLTEHLPEDGTAEELYQQIQAEKQSLIKAGKIKKEKPLPEISADEIPFGIPITWKWVRLGLISSQITDGEHKTPRRVSIFCGYYLLSARNITNGSIKLDNVDYVNEKEYDIISKRCNPKRNDVLISCSGSIGRCCVVEDDNKYVMVRSAAMVSLIKVHPKWVMYCIHSNALQKQISNKAKATAQANLFQEPIKRLVIPLPPLAEQKRIVERLTELLAVCDKLK